MSTNTNRVRDWAVEAAEAAMLLMESPAIDDAGKVVTDSTELMWLIAGRIREAYAAEQPAAQEAVAVLTMSQRHDALGSRMSFVRLTGAARLLPAGKHSLYTRPAGHAAVPKELETPWYFGATEAGTVFTYTKQPGNVDAWRLGLACTGANTRSAGDPIDRGLGLLAELQDRGFGVVSLAARKAK